MKSAVLTLAGIIAVYSAAAAQDPHVPVVPAASIALVAGKPLAFNSLQRSVGRHENVSVTLELNDHKDRLGARFVACEHPLGYDLAGDCEELLFVFPTATVDRTQKMVFADGQPIVKLGGFWSGIHPAKPWRLKYKLTPQVYDTGFNRVRYDQVEVWLER